MSWSLSEGIWDRGNTERKGHAMSRYAFMSAVSLFTIYGMILCAAIAYNTMHWLPTNFWIYLGIGLGIPIIGIIIACTSNNWFASLLGYTMVVAGLGAITGPTVALYKTTVVINALMATCGVTLVMSLTGILIKRSLEGWGSYLFGALLSLLFVRIAQIFMAGMGMEPKTWYMPWIEYLGAVLFSLYIIYDWNRALRLPRTMDNAVDSALAIFLDIINLFLHLLRIMGGRGSSSSD